MAEWKGTAVWKGMVLFEDHKLFARPTLLDTNAFIVAEKMNDAELLTLCLSDLSDPIILRSVTKEATNGGRRSPIRLEFSWPYGYVKLVHHIRNKLEPSSSSYLAADTSGGGRLLTLVVELPEALGEDDKYCTGWILLEEEPPEDPITEVGAGLEEDMNSTPQSPEPTMDIDSNILEIGDGLEEETKSKPQFPEPSKDLDCNINESQRKLFNGLNVDEPVQPNKTTEPKPVQHTKTTEPEPVQHAKTTELEPVQHAKTTEPEPVQHTKTTEPSTRDLEEPVQHTKTTEPSTRDLEPFFSEEEAETLDAKEKCISLDQDDGSKKSMGWKKIARFFIAPDSKPELELQDLVTRGHGSVQVDFRQVGFEPRKVRFTTLYQLSRTYKVLFSGLPRECRPGSERF